MTKQELVKLIADNNADGWYVHCGNRTITEHDDSFVILFAEAKNVNDVAHYGDVMSFVKLDSETVRVDSMLDEIRERMQAAYDNSTLPVWMVDAIESNGIDALVAECNPEDIVNSAQMWDDCGFVRWFCDAFNGDVNTILTNDGAVVMLAGEIQTEIVTIMADEYEDLHYNAIVS